MEGSRLVADVEVRHCGGQLTEIREIRPWNCS
jgi:hypothetical protein